MSSDQIATVKSVMVLYASYINLEIQYVSGSAARSADIRIAQSDLPSTAWAYYPDRDEGGDVWFNANARAYDKPLIGSYGWMTYLHEIGHAFGLKHGHEHQGEFGALPDEVDSLEFTVMTYRSYVGADGLKLSNGSADYPQTLMMADIHALQSLYGADFSKAGTELVYSWSPTTGETFMDGVSQGAVAGNRIFMTVWSAGAEVTYDLSQYDTDLQVDLRPGAWSTFSNAQLARLERSGSELARGNVANAELVQEGALNNLVANAIGGSGDDHIIGNATANSLTGGAGDDRLEGGAGSDTAVFSGRASDYFWSKGAAGWLITDVRAEGDGADVLVDIEWLAFSDGTLAITTPSQRPAVASPNTSDQVATPPKPATGTPEAAVVDWASAYRNVLWQSPDAAQMAWAADARPGDSAWQAALATLIDAADTTTSVVTMTYQFFTGAIPSAEGMSWLLSGSPHSLGSDYYADWSLERRFINFAVNLASTSQAFQNDYGKLSSEAALTKAYQEIFGVLPDAAKIDLLLHTDVDAAEGVLTREAYFQALGGGDGLDAKAAMVGWLLAEAVKADQGAYARANEAFLTDLADGASMGIDLIGVYASSPLEGLAG